jgi:hypothetical protein
MIYSPVTDNQGETLVILTITIYNGVKIAVSQCHILCAWWVLDVAWSPSGCPTGSPMDVLSSPLLQTYCLSCSPLGGPGLPSASLLMVTTFPSGSIHSLISSSTTIIFKRNIQVISLYIQYIYTLNIHIHIHIHIHTYTYTYIYIHIHIHIHIHIQYIYSLYIVQIFWWLFIQWYIINLILWLLKSNFWVIKLLLLITYFYKTDSNWRISGRSSMTTLLPLAM